jgi:two-component system CheB/CheR fusion protein
VTDTDPSTGASTGASSGAPPGDARRICIVGIGASAGGLEAIREMLTEARREANLAYVVIQHLDPNHESLLAELLSRHTELTVAQAEDGDRVQRGSVYIIPPGKGMALQDGVLKLTDFAEPRGLRRPIDDFFESLAEDQGRHAACVILSGTGADGSAGLRAIKEHDGLCIAQDARTAKYDGMPLAAERTGMVDFVRSPDTIIECIEQFFAHSIHSGSEQVERTVEESIDDIAAVLRRSCGHDFSGYKRSTLVRRIQRRIQVLGLKDATDYLRFIRQEDTECDALFSELLINVTRFFRDPEHFESLRARVIQPLVAEAADRGTDRGEEPELRVWVPGCSSGEEAYSLAMLLADEQDRSGRAVPVQIFATDIDEQMLNIAREAVYPQAALADIPEALRERFTVARDGKFRVSKRIRQMVRFSAHSVVRDPPFSNIDLLACRNLLIYFAEKLQDLALPLFHYAVRPGGYLFLGPSETLSRFGNLFLPLDSKARIFRRNQERPEYPITLRPTDWRRLPARRESNGETPPQQWSEYDVTAKVLHGYAPAALHVNDSGQILGATGRLGKFLDFTPAEREPQHAQSIARAGLREAVSAIIREATRRRRKVITHDLRAHSEFGVQPFDLVADPFPDGTLLLVFREKDRFEAHAEDEGWEEDDDLEDFQPSDTHVQALEEELRATRSRLHTTVEELETANEELKSSNEEMMSMNEELQSTNEELSTVNDELKEKVDQLSVANADLSNIFASTTLPLIVLDQRMRIRNYTDAALAIYPFRRGDRDRPLSEVTGVLAETDQILGAVQQVMADGKPQTLRVSERGGERAWSLAVTPYFDPDGAGSGAVLVLTELTDALRLQDELNHAGERLRLALEVANLGIWEYDGEAGEVQVDRTGRRLMGLKEGQEALSLTQVLRRVAQADRRAFDEAMRSMCAEGDGFDITVTLSDGDSPRALRVVGRRVEAGRHSRTLGMVFDVTEELEARRVRELMIREMNHRVKNMFAIIVSIARLAGRSARDVPELMETLERRIEALARSHDMTQRPAGIGPVTLESTIRAAVAPYEQVGSIEIAGPEVLLSPEELTALSLLMHEWATNAAKYGVLGAREGRLEVRWQRVGRKKISLTWNEIYSEPINNLHEGDAGFGSTLIGLAAAGLDGKVTTEPAEDGRKTRFDFDITKE